MGSSVPMVKWVLLSDSGTARTLLQWLWVRQVSWSMAMLKYMPGFKNCQLEQTAHRVGVRVSRCIRGVETLTEDILFSEERHEPVALIWRDFGAHSNNKKFTASWGKHKDGCGAIPMKSLVSDRFENVLAAGRCISAEVRLSNTVRMMGTCMATGEAAGILVYLAAKNKKSVKDIEYAELRPVLEAGGAILE